MRLFASYQQAQIAHEIGSEQVPPTLYLCFF